MHSRISSVLARPMLRNFLTAFVLVFAMGAFAYIMRAQQEQGAMPEAQATSVSGVTSSNKTFNPLQVALLHWYDANLVGEISLPNAAPFGMAFDGSNMWIASQGVGVFKVRASDGVKLATVTGLQGPAGLAFDGTNIWVSEITGNSVAKIAGNGTVRGTFPVAAAPLGLTFDGANIWVASVGSSTLTKLRASDGANL